MCDQDHFDDDRHEFETRGLVTRRQFGVLLGAGVAMMLPQVVNAVTVTDGDVTVTTPDGTCDAYFVHPASGTAPGVLFWPDIFGLRPSMRQMGKRLAESGYSVLVVNPFYRVKKAPTAEQGAATPIPQLMPLAQALNETTHMTDAKAFIGVAGPAGVGGQEPEGRNAGILHGRPDGVSHGGGSARPCRRGRLVPWRRARHRESKQSASAGRENQGAVPCRDRRERRRAGAERQDRVEGDVRKGEPARGNRGLHGRATAGARRIRRSTASRRPRRHGAVCSRCTARRWPDRSSASAQKGGHLAEHLKSMFEHCGGGLFESARRGCREHGSRDASRASVWRSRRRGADHSAGAGSRSR